MSTFSRRHSDQILFRLPFPLLTCPSYSAATVEEPPDLLKAYPN